MSDSITVNGTVRVMNETETFNSGFTKRTIVVETDAKYPQMLPIAFTKDRIEKLDNVGVGDFVEIGVNLRSNEYPKDSGRFYVNLEGWMIKVLAGSVTPESHPMPDEPFDGQDLPF